MYVEYIFPFSRSPNWHSTAHIVTKHGDCPSNCIVQQFVDQQCNHLQKETKTFTKATTTVFLIN